MTLSIFKGTDDIKKEKKGDGVTHQDSPDGSVALPANDPVDKGKGTSIINYRDLVGFRIERLRHLHDY